MKQFTYWVKQSGDAAQALQRANLDVGAVFAADMLITIITPLSMSLDEALTLRVAALRQFPSAKIIGYTSNGFTAASRLSEHGFLFAFTVFESASVDIALLSGDSSQEDIVSGFVSFVSSQEDTKAVEILVAGSVHDISRTLNKFSVIDGNIKIIGGFVDCVTVSAYGYIFTNDTAVTNGIAALAFSGERLEVCFCDNFGWTPLGGELEITEMEGNILRKIDGISPLSIYNKYFGMEDDTYFAFHGSMFPLVFEKEDGKLFACVPIQVVDDEYFAYNLPPKQGAIGRLAYGDPYKILKFAADNHHRLTAFEPQAIIGVGCVTHRMLLGQDVVHELPLQQTVPAFCPFVFGEIYRDGEEITIVNLSLLTLGLKERYTAPIEINSPLEPKTISDLNPMSKLFAFMTHFIRVADHELNVVNKRLSHMANCDPLTGLLNRRAIEPAIDEALVIVREKEMPLSIAMMDIDKFKSINDTFGHEAGDIALKMVAEVIKENIRSTDYACRWGGDEFFIILQNTPLEIAAKIAERIRSSMEVKEMPFGHNITLSIGVVAVRADIDDNASLFQAADASLYKAKKLGRNTVAVMESYAEDEAAK